MPTSKTVEILHAFQELKKRKHKIDKSQYVKELLILKEELDLHIQNPHLSEEEMKKVQFLLGN